MARIGSGIRPELGRADYSPIARGGEALGRGIAKAGEGFGDFLKAQKERKQETEEGISRLEAFATVTTDPNIRGFIEEQVAYMKDEDNPLRDRLARAKNASSAIDIFQKKTDQDIGKVLAGQEFALRERELGMRERMIPYELEGMAARTEAARAGAEATRSGAKLDDKKFQAEVRRLESQLGDLPRQADLDERAMRVRERGMNVAEAQAQAAAAEALGRELTEGERAFQRNMGTELGAWESRGKQTAATNLQKLDAVIDKLKSGKGRTGFIQGRLPSGMRSEGLAMQEDIESIIFQALKATLGGNFTEKEAFRLIKTAYNPVLPEKENLKKLEYLRDDLRRRVEDKDRQLKQFRKTGFVGMGESPSTTEKSPSKEGTEVDLLRMLDPEASFNPGNPLLPQR